MKVDKSTSDSIQLYTFLREFARLGQKPVESVDSYIKTFWLDEIPREPECSFVAWNAPSEDDESDPDSWLTVERPEKPGPPPVAENVLPWVNTRQWHDSRLEYPELLLRILNPAWDEDDPDAAPQFLELKDHSEVQIAWDDYVESEWWGWAEEDRRKAQVQKCYDELFGMHRTQVSVGEQYEFLLSVGCLHWSAPSGVRAKRHLLVLPITVDFDSVNAAIAVRSAGSAPEVQFETDMLSLRDCAPTEIEDDARARCQLLADDLFQDDAKTLVKAYVQGLDSEGSFVDTIERVSGKPPAKPKVQFSPALIVRRRTTRNLEAACNKIISQLQDEPGGRVPPVVRKIAGELGVDTEGSGESSEERADSDKPDREVYFPLLSNDEQKRILGALSRQSGILVQGPPGTGKSQTIANLICHLLANGKRILVTSQKAPALRVLKKKLPKEVADLCMMILGDSADEQQVLRRSVGSVVSRHATHSHVRSQEQVRMFREELNKARREEAESYELLCAVREVETDPACFGGYKGTLGEIAALVRRDAECLGWFKDTPLKPNSLTSDSPPPLPVRVVDIERLLQLLRGLDNEEEIRAKMHLLSLDALPTPSKLKSMVAIEKAALDAFETQKQSLDHPARDALVGSNAADLSILLKSFDDLLRRLQQAHATESEWQREATTEILRGNSASFKALQTASGEILDRVPRGAKEVADFDVIGLGNRSYRVVLQDARDLKLYLAQSKWCGVGPLRPAVVKRGLYLMKEVRVDGRECNSPQILGKLILWLELQESIRQLAEQWSNLTALDTDRLPLNQVLSCYGDLQSWLDTAMAVGEDTRKLERRLNAIDPSIHCSWHDIRAVNSLRCLVAALVSQYELCEASREIAETVASIHDVCHAASSAPENCGIRNAIQSRLCDEYARNHDELTRLWECRRASEERDELLREISKKLPELAQSLTSSYSDTSWDERLQRLGDAWNWRCADTWLTQMTDSDLEDSLNAQVKRAQCDSSRALAQIATEKAWQHCMTSLTEASYQSLMAWHKAFGRLGRGMGKYASRDRALAKERLEECREAIPAWVMPLYKVLETVDVRPEVFDVVIIDEASQSGPDALFLTFLAKQVIVVGDDQQIRPEQVGINHGDVHELQKRYLRDTIPKWDIFSVTESLFGISEVRFGNPIRLREHFRCMPEIIAFSNRICYQDQPLLPLRQYGKHRLDPLVHQYVRGGYQEGRKVNPVEAEKVADAIEKCCEDPAYAGKTFGVITLLHSSDQDREIENLLLKRLDAEEIEKRNIVCGDAYDFQGDQRDVIFLSMVSARSDKARIGTLSDDKAKRRFNVAVSRACDQVQLFHSVQEGELSENCLRRRLLSYMKRPTEDPTSGLPWTLKELRDIARNTPRQRGNQPKPFDSWFEVDVYLAITAQGYTAIPQYRVHDYRIDIVIIGGARRLAVECDGDQWHGPDQYRADRHRQTQLERCDWEFFRVRGSRFYRDPDGALQPLWEMLETTDGVTGDGNNDHETEGNEQSQAPESDAAESSDGPSDLEPVDEASRTMAEAEEDFKQEIHTSHNRDSSSSSSSESKPNAAASKKAVVSGSSVDDILSMSSRELGRVLCDILEGLANHSCKKDDLTYQVCKHYSIRTHSGPRKQLTKKIGWAVTHLKKAGKLKEYRAKNIRVRLVNPDGQGKLWE